MRLFRILHNIIIRIFYVLLCLISTNQLLQAQNFTREQVLEDISFVVKTLKSNHPNLYAHRKPKQFASMVEDVRESVDDEENYYGVLFKIQRILAAVCDEHTGVTTDGMETYNNRSIDDQRYVFSQHLIALPRDGDPVLVDGTDERVESINGYDARQIRDYIYQLANADGCADDGIVFTKLRSFFESLILSNILEIDRYYLKKAHTPDDLKTQTSLVSADRVAAALERQHSDFQEQYRRRELLAGIEIQLPTPPVLIDPKLNDSGISVYSNPDKSIYYINSFSFSFGLAQVERTDALLREMIASKPRHVILDLTSNYGGQSKIASHLLSYFLNKPHRIASSFRMRNPRSKLPREYTFLNDEKKKSFAQIARQFRKVKPRNGQYRLHAIKENFGNPDYKGNLLVLVSPQTHSGATAVATVLKRKRNAKLIGYINAGSIRTTCAAAFGFYSLPVTKISVRIPGLCFDRPKNLRLKGKTLKPDIEVDPLSGATYLNVKILDAAIKDIAEAQ